MNPTNLISLKHASQVSLLSPRACEEAISTTPLPGDLFFPLEQYLDVPNGSYIDEIFFSELNVGSQSKRLFEVSSHNIS